jgi:hypothetical protein
MSRIEMRLVLNERQKMRVMSDERRVTSFFQALVYQIAEPRCELKERSRSKVRRSPLFLQLSFSKFGSRTGKRRSRRD